MAKHGAGRTLLLSRSCRFFHRIEIIYQESNLIIDLLLQRFPPLATSQYFPYLFRSENCQVILHKLLHKGVTSKFSFGKAEPGFYYALGWSTTWPDFIFRPWMGGTAKVYHAASTILRFRTKVNGVHDPSWDWANVQSINDKSAYWSHPKNQFSGS